MGLGLKFLAHHRCKIILHLCELSVDNHETLIRNYTVIKNELENYADSTLKKEVILLSKSDLVDSKKIDKYVKMLKKVTQSEIIPFSSHNNFGMEELKSCLSKTIK